MPTTQKYNCAICRHFLVETCGRTVLARKVYLFQPQYANCIGDHVDYWLPYSVAAVWVYAVQDPEICNGYELAGIVYDRRPIDQVCAGLQEPDVCAFSCYVWNEQYNLALARQIKSIWPRCLVVFGGPQTGANHLAHDFIDHIVFSEGETALRQILRDRLTGDVTARMLRLPRLRDLDIVSTYLSGVFDDLICGALPGTRWHAVIETNRGCPYACTFCDWGTLTYSKVRKFDIDRVQAELEWIARHPITVVFLADANFGIFRQRDLDLAHRIRDTLVGSQVEYLNMTYTKNSNETVFEIAKILQPLSRGVTLSMQTMNADTLRTIRRDNMASNDLRRQFELARQHKIPTYTDMILGLPGETLESWRQGLVDLLMLGTPDFIDTNFTNILENTELNKSQRLTHGIRTVRARNYQDFSDADTSGIAEYTELVTATATMSESDMVQGWMWHWCLQFFHVTGYSDIISGWLAHDRGVSLSEFYSILESRVIQDSSAVGEEYRRTQSQVQQLLSQGKLDPSRGTVYDLYSGGYVPLWQNIQHTRDLVRHTAETFAPVDPALWRLQCLVVSHPSNRYPVYLDVDWNIDQKKPTMTRYGIQVGLPDFDGSITSFRRNRRGGFWKNIISVL